MLFGLGVWAFSDFRFTVVVLMGLLLLWLGGCGFVMMEVGVC